MNDPFFFPRPSECQHRGQKLQGFTLIEILVSTAILAMMVVFIAQVIGNAGQAWKHGREKMDNFGKARAMLNRLEIDIENIVLRGDLSTFPSNGGASSLAFYTLQRGVHGNPGSSPADVRALSYVEYTGGINSSEKDRILRRDLAYSYGDSPSFGTAPAPAPSPASTPSVPSPDSNASTNVELFRGQLGFIYGFLHPDGKYSSRYDRNSSDAESRAIAVTVGILVMDNESAAILKERGNLLSQLISDFKIDDISPAGWSPKAIWDYQLGLNKTVPAGTHAKIDLKKYGISFVSGIQAFERTFPLPGHVVN